MPKNMTNIDIREYEGGDFGKIEDNYTDRQVQVAIANRAEKLIERIENIENNPDVVDIVATYQDLQNYDTSGLTDKDIIRVLEDSTHNDKSTYYRWNAATSQFDFVGEIGGGGPTVVQTTGTSTTDVMSQNATTNMIYPDNSNRTIFIAKAFYGVSNRVGDVFIGEEVNCGTFPIDYKTGIGSYSRAIGSHSTALGSGANASEEYSIGLGAYSNATQKGQLDVSTSRYSASSTDGYNNSPYRLITGLYDPQSAHDAATKGYVDTAVASAGGVKVLTTDDYNYPESNPTGVALWLLEPGMYELPIGVQGYINIYFGPQNAGSGTWVIMPGTYGSDKVVVEVHSSGAGDINSHIARVSDGARLGASQTILDSSKVVNNLTSTSSSRVLSAAQGKVLNDKIGGDLSNLATTDKTSLIAAINELTARVAALEGS